MRFDPENWSDDSARDALRLIADSVTQMVGFEVAVVSLAQGHEMVTVAVAGPESLHRAMGEMRTPIDLILREIEAAEDWGRFRFLSHDLPQAAAAYGWTPDIEPSTEADGWHPEDELIAPLHDGQGDLLGLLSIDVPVNGRRPDVQQRQLLERYAAQAERALVIAVDREALSQRVRLAEATRQVVRFAASQPDIEQALDDCRDDLLEGFRADDLTIRTYPHAGIPAGGSPPTHSPQDVRQTVFALARAGWRQQRVTVIGPDYYAPDQMDEADFATVRDYTASLGYESAMLVPIGAGSVCLGHLIMFRKDAGLPWTPGEQQSCLDVARDIGQAVLSARTLAREQRLVTELRELASYKTELLSTVSHELKNPLGAISGHLEMLQATEGLPADVEYSVAAMTRASRRLGRVIDDLLTLATVQDPTTPISVDAVDLRLLLQSSLELSRFAAERRDLRIEVVAPDGPLVVLGEEDGLERLVGNLVSNAGKYTPRGGRVLVSVALSSSQLELTVSDEGIGISAEDQERLFTEFFRSTNPAALAEPGTGLGLAICARIVARHHGRIEVESELGRGSTFRVVIPQPT
ncbi:hypothetical protein BH11ACT8_BH11ACT8_11070 [soil metagenome]